MYRRSNSESPEEPLPRSKTSHLQLLKEILFSVKSKARVTNADRVIGYSDNQLSYLNLFGVKPSKNYNYADFFFDPMMIEGIVPEDGEYFVMAGQNIVAKGWHLIPDLIKRSNGIKYKLIMRNEKEASALVNNHELSEYVENGSIEILLCSKSYAKRFLKSLLNQGPY